MRTYNDLQGLRRLPKEVLAEIIREGEDRLKAQLAVATAADQRALTIGGTQLTAATASLAGGIALARGSSPDLWLAFVAIAFACALVTAAYFGIHSVRPGDFDFPGNRPSAWLPDRWLGGETDDFSMEQARIEQAACIDDAIRDNRKVMDKAAAAVNTSLNISLQATAVAALVLLGTLISRNWTIAEPVSQIVRS